MKVLLLSFFVFTMLINTVSANQPDIELTCTEYEDIVLSPGQYAVCAFETKNDEDIAFFNLRKDDLVSVSALRFNSMMGISFQVYTENNVQVVQRTSYQYGTVSFKAPDSGKYKIKIQGRYIEPYILQVNSFSSTIDENPLGFEMYHNSIDYINDYDLYKFYAEAETSIRLDVFNLAYSGLSAKVYTSEGIEISSIAASSPEKSTIMEFTSSGIYYIQLVSKKPVNYSLQLTCESEYCPHYQEPQPFTPDFSAGMLHCLEDITQCNAYFGL